jgi:ubiquinone/menaquinone biosynthesis C-methylase UbiE
MEDVKSYYDERSKSYDEAFQTLYFKVYDAIAWRYLEPYVPTGYDALALDAGGGTGRWAVRMAEKGCKVILMDSSEGMLRMASRRVETDGLQQRITIRKGDITKTGFENDTFDLVLFEHALFLFRNPDVVIRELVRALKPKGCLIISAQNRYVQVLSSLSGKPNADNVERALKMLLSKEHLCMTEDGKVEIYTWTPEEFRAMLERNGLRVEKIVGKVVTMVLRVRKETYTRMDYPQELYDKLLQFELSVCEESDALALAGHMQAITRKP